MEMTYERWVELNKQIYDRHAHIAQRTQNMAWLKTAHPGNPEFVALMQEQARLIEAADRYLELLRESNSESGS